jgi:cytochrome c-type biogenesis protein CcmE
VIDLTPLEPESRGAAVSATGTPTGTAELPKRGRRGWVVGAVIVAAVGFLAVHGLDSATLYFRTADEAVAQRAALGTHRFRLEGTVVPGTVRQAAQHTEFTVTANHVDVAVVHSGDPPQLFQPGIAVVLEGRFQGDRFASVRMLVRHSNEYTAKHPDRLTTTTAVPNR